MANPATINLDTVKRGDTYIVDFFYQDSDGTTDISAITIDAQARRELDGALWFDLKPVVINASDGHFRIHLTSLETREITEAPPGSFSGIFDIQFSWAGAAEVFVATMIAGSISISKDITYQGTGQSLIPDPASTLEGDPSQTINLQGSTGVNGGPFSDQVTAEEISPNVFQMNASLGLANIDYIDQAARSAAAAKSFAEVAQSEAAKALASEKIATAQATTATIKANEAKDAAALATQVSGLDTVAEAVDAELDSRDSMVLTAAQRQAIIDANEEKYAASGFVHMGKHRDAGALEHPVNEGLYVRPDTPNALRLGRSGGSATAGSSKSGLSVTHIAGVVSSLLCVNTYTPTTAVGTQILLPPAPDGTVIYDSTGNARGTGKANLNLLTEVDPKYGDSAEDLYGVGTVAAKNEASARAFEGAQSYGDFRGGLKSSENSEPEGWNYYATGGQTFTLVDGVLNVKKVGSTPYGLISSRIYEDSVGSEYEVSFTLNSGAMAILRYSQSLTGHTDIFSVSESFKIGRNTFRYKTTTAYHCLWFEGGVDFSISSVSIRKVTEEVVTDRVDMFGLEQFDMVAKDGEIFDMIQSQATTFGDTGVPTVTSVRPDSFFAAYDGQENIVKGKCVRWPDLNRAQKRHIAKYMKERLWVNEDGDLTFTAIRQRSIAGAGNGDWHSVDASWSPDFSFSSGNTLAAVQAQGVRDDLGASGSLGSYTVFGTSGLYRPIDYPDGNINRHSVRGAFAAGLSSTPSDRAYEGRCFFYVLGTVSRLNQGAFVKGLNESGCGLIANDFNGDGSTDQGSKWYALPGDAPKTRAECFKASQYGSDFKRGVYVNSSGVRSGAIGQPSGRDDGRFYDAIYADGLGGVVDRRLPAYASDSPEEAAKVWEKVKNGTYRGLERLVRFAPKQYNPASGNVVYIRSGGTGTQNNFIYSYNLNSANTRGELVGSSLFVTDGTNYAWGVLGNNDTSARVFWTQLGNTGLDTDKILSESDSVVLWTEKPVNLSVSGEFTQTDVIGDPANILQTDALKDGWLGSWIPVIPDGVNKDYPLTRKSLVSSASALYTTNVGATWTSTGAAIEAVKNTINSTTPAINIVMWEYTAFAKQTVESANKPVLNGDAGLGVITQLARSDYSQAMESLIGKVGTSNSNKDLGCLTTLSYLIDHINKRKSSGLLLAGRYAPTHTPVDLDAPTNNSPAVKALPYQIADNGQCSLGVQANELTYATASVLPVTMDTAMNDAALSVGSVFKIVGGELAGIYIMRNKSLTSNSFQARYDNGSIQKDRLGNINWSGSASTENTLVAESFYSASWGDDGVMKITASGSDTFVDLNGNTNLSVVHELALPYGWTKNRARAGVQVEGVDL